MKCYWCEEETALPYTITGKKYCQSCFAQLTCDRCNQGFEFDDDDCERIGHIHLHEECAWLDARDEHEERMADEMHERWLTE